MPLDLALPQTWANNSTSHRYSTKTRRFRKFSCMNLWKSSPSYSTRVQVEYLYFRRIYLYLKTRLITRYSTRYSTRGLVTQPRFFNFGIRLRLDLGYKAFIFASTTNLESGPRFTEICFTKKSCAFLKRKIDNCICDILPTRIFVHIQWKFRLRQIFSTFLKWQPCNGILLIQPIYLGFSQCLLWFMLVFLSLIFNL